MREAMKDKENKIFFTVSGIILLFAFIGSICFVKSRVAFLLNSDDASELILGQLLANENTLLSKSWYYSSELRLVNTQIFYAFFFKIFHNWHKVRIASYVCLYLVLIASYYFACKALHIKRYFLITAALLMLPFSEDYFLYVLKGAYYIPHIAITFFTLGLCEFYIAEEKEKRQKLYLMAALLASLLAGMGGARQVMILYLPLLAASILLAKGRTSIADEKIHCALDRGERKYVLFAVLSFAGAALGYIINTKFLSQIYSFQIWDAIFFTGFDLSRLSQLINGFLTSYGYRNGNIFSLALLYNFLCICWLFLTLYSCVHTLKNRTKVKPAHYRMALFTMAAFLLFILLYLFTSLSYINRYNLPIIILSIPMIAILFQNTGLKAVTNYAAITIFVLLITCSGYVFYKEESKIDITAEFRSIVAALQEEDCTEGYSTFWLSNVLTELSNGDIEVWHWKSSDSKGYISAESIDDTDDWLQPKSHDDTHPEGKLFLLFTTAEWENTPWTEKLSTEDIIYQSDEYIVIGYENYDTLQNDMMQQ